MPIVWISPAPLDTPVGGFFYASCVVAGLRAAGHAVEVVSEPALDALNGAASRGDRVVIDGLALPAFVGQGDAVAASGAVGLVHHPAAMGEAAAESERAGSRNAALRLLPRLHRVIASSQSVADRLVAEFGVEPARVAVVVPGTDDAPRGEGSGGPGCAVLSVGALIPRKGHDVLLRALARLFDLDWTLVIAGSATREPSHAVALRDLADGLGIAEKVRFAGALDRAALESLWRRADLFALASHWEAYGGAAAEAMRRGIAVAVTSGGAAANLVPVGAGGVAPPGDVDQLSKAIRRLIFSPALRAEMAETAWQAGRSLPDWPTQVRAFARALEG